MRFGFCGNLVATGPDGTGIEFVEKIAQFGYDYVELPIAEMTALSEQEFSALKSRVAATGLRCESCNNFFPGTQRLTGPDVNDSTVEEYYTKALDRAHALGAETIVFGSYAAKRVPDGYSHERAFEQLVVLHRKIGAAAHDRGIVIAIEPVRTPWANIITTYEEGYRLAKAVSHPNIRMLLDNYHMDHEGESADVLFGRSDLLSHVHFSNPNLQNHPKDPRIVPVDISEWDYTPLINALRTVGYQGRMSVEAETSDFDADAPRALAIMRQHFNW